jgi:hypothetical protein
MQAKFTTGRLAAANGRRRHLCASFGAGGRSGQVTWNGTNVSALIVGAESRVLQGRAQRLRSGPRVEPSRSGLGVGLRGGADSSLSLMQTKTRAEQQ